MPSAPLTLRQLREQAGIPQTSVATFMKVAQATVSGWEHGRLVVPEERRAELRQVLGCTAEELVTALSAAVVGYEAELDSRLGDRLRTLRHERGLSQEQVAEATDVTTGAVAMWERGSNTPSLARLEALSTVFALSPDELLTSAGWDEDERKDFLERPERADTPLAELLREARIAANLSQQQVAAAIGVAQNSVSAMETAHYSPNPETLDRLTRLFDLDQSDVAVAVFETRREAGVVPSVSLPWPLDPVDLPRSRWFRQLRAHLGWTRAQLGGHLGIATSTISDAEQPDGALPRALRDSATLEGLAELAQTDQGALRRAWQVEEVVGIEYLIGLPVVEQVEVADRFDHFLRAQVLVGRTQTEIAEAAGVSREGARRWVEGLSVPAVGKLPDIAELLGVEVEQLHALRARTKRPPAAGPGGTNEADPETSSDAERIFGSSG